MSQDGRDPLEERNDSVGILQQQITLILEDSIRGQAQ